MLAKTLLSAALAASAVSAYELYPGHQAIKRDLAARQTASGVAASASGGAIDASGAMACLTPLESAYASLPTPPPALESFVETASVTDPCHFTYPASLSDAIKSYESQVTSWYDANSAAIASALSQCPQFSSYSSLAGSGVGGDICSTTAAGGGSGGSGGAKTTGGSGATTTGGSGSKTSSTGSATGAATTNAGPKETAFAGAAVLVAGVLGAVAAL